MSNLHTDILSLLRAAGKYGLDVDTLLRDLRQLRHRELAAPALEKALRDLADESFASPFMSALKKQRWGITGLGENALTQEGL